METPIDPRPVFAFQLGWFLLVWSVITVLVIWPWAQRLSLRDRLSVFIAPEMFRVLGVGLLAPNLSPGMPMEFAGLTVVCDVTTSVLALSAFIALRRGAAAAKALTWAATVVGMGDLIIALPHASATGALKHLAAQWYVPVFAGPVMVLAHVCCLITLIRTRGTKLEAQAA